MKFADLTPEEQEEVKVAYERYLNDNADELDVENKQHDNIGFGTRLKIKNLANTNEEKIYMLKQRFPEYDVREKNGEVVVRAPGEASFSKLDPSGFQLNDLVADAGDILWDVGAGAVEGVGAAAGFLAGAAGGPVGAIAGGAAGGAAAGAGMETLRQGLRASQDLEFSGDDITTSALFGGAAGPLLGSGAKIVKAGAKGMVKKDLATALLSKMPKGGKLLQKAEKNIANAVDDYAKANSGVLVNALKKGRSVGSNINQEIIDTASQNLDELEGITDIHSFIDDKVANMDVKFKDELKKVGNEIGSVLNEVDEGVDLDPVWTVYQQELDKIRGLSKLSNENKAILNELQSKLDSVFPSRPKKVGEVVQDISPEGVVPQGVFAPRQEQVISEITKMDPEKMDVIIEMRNQLAELAKSNKQVSFGDRLSGLAGGKKKLADAAVKIRSAIDEQVEAALERVGGREDAVADWANLKEKYGAVKNLQESLMPKLKNEETAYSTLRNITKAAKQRTFKKLKEADKVLGTGFEHDAKLIGAYSQFGDPPGLLSKISTGGQGNQLVNLAGSAIGNQIGQDMGEGGGLQGAIIGGAATSALFSPRSLRAQMKGARMMSKARDIVPLPSGTVRRNLMNQFKGKDETRSPYERIK